MKKISRSFWQTLILLCLRSNRHQRWSNRFVRIEISPTVSHLWYHHQPRPRCSRPMNAKQNRHFELQIEDERCRTGLISERKPPGTSFGSSGFGCKNLNEPHFLSSGWHSHHHRHLQSIIETHFTFIRMRYPMNETFRFDHTFIRHLLTRHFQFDRFVIRALTISCRNGWFSSYLRWLTRTTSWTVMI